jgi:hypothetical protein
MLTTDESLAQLVEIAEEQLRWLRASVLRDVRTSIESALTTTQLRRAYEMCNGDTTSRDIANAVAASPASLSNWTRRWRDVGIAYETDRGRIKHLVSLAALGIPVEVSSP